MVVASAAVDVAVVVIAVVVAATVVEVLVIAVVVVTTVVAVVVIAVVVVATEVVLRRDTPSFLFVHMCVLWYSYGCNLRTQAFLCHDILSLQD